MKKYFLIIILFAFTGSIGHSQTIGDFRKMSSEQKANILSDSLKTILHLSESQYVKVKNVLQQGITESQPIVHSEYSRFSKIRQLKRIRDKYQPQIKSILSTQQWQLWEHQKKEIIAYYRSELNKMPLRMHMDK